MPTSNLMKHCVECKKKTMHFQEKPNHILHLLLSIITVGIWLVVAGVLLLLIIILLL